MNTCLVDDRGMLAFHDKKEFSGLLELGTQSHGVLLAEEWMLDG
jgi:hypothetical protein